MPSSFDEISEVEPSSLQSLSKCENYLWVQDAGFCDGNLGASDVGSEERQRHEGGGSDGEALADSSRCVTGGIECVCALTDLLAHAGHLSNSTGVIGDRSVGINSQSCRESSNQNDEKSVSTNPS